MSRSIARLPVVLFSDTDSMLGSLPAVLARWRHLEVAAGRLEWMDSMVLRGTKALPIAVER